MQVKIWQEDCPFDPREWGIGEFICWHRRYDLGDSHNYSCPEEFPEDLAREWGGEEELDHLEDVKNRYEDILMARGLGWLEAGKRAEQAVAERKAAIIERTIDQGVVIPLYLYDHSGLALSAAPFACRWDSGQVGYAVISPEVIADDFEGKRELAEGCLRSEIEVYGYYVSGEVYGFTLFDEEGEVADSCGGFYGYDMRRNGMLDYLPEGGWEVVE